ncbi:heavy metal translocating P-type ATPase [Photobacterium minamisatsumaniensis]|uniref:heavy metal translocating P-type ATPase n=1 Tax=Photobacterium minamisatsumaniensis TaxID=2910233 RepID=UPI003D0E39CF
MSECASKSCCSSAAVTRSNAVSIKGNKSYRYSVTGMDCAACAAKIEKALQSMKPVRQVRVTFATERLIAILDEDADPDLIEQTVNQLGFRLKTNDSDEELPFWKNYTTFSLLASLMTIATILTAIDSGFGEIGFYIATVVGVVPFAYKSFMQMKNGTWFGIETLMTVAAIGALILGETVEAGLVLLLFSIGEMLEGFASQKAKAGIKSLMNLTPDTALKVENGERLEVQADFLNPGDTIEVLPGSRLPVDGILESQLGIFDESALTGESIPITRNKGEKILAGSLVEDQPVRLTVESEAGNNAIDRIITLIEEAEERRAPIARMVDAFSAWYTPLVMALAALVMVIPPMLFGAEWMPWVYKALALLLIACPCALVVSIPAAVTSALTSASRFGALIKGGASLEQLKDITKLAFDKTGTLTEGKPKVTAVLPYGETLPTLLKLATSVEQGSSHPLAKAIIEYSQDNGVERVEANNIQVINGRGVIGDVEGRKIQILAPRYVAEGVLSNSDCESTVQELESKGNTVVVVLEDQNVLGLIGIADTLRDDAKQAIDELKRMGISSVMLTGDNRRAAASIANELGIDYKAELLPEDKVTSIIQLQDETQGAVAMIGDGINDAPALKTAELGIAMGRGSDIALETADAAITHEQLTKLPMMIQLSKNTASITRQNIVIALGINTFFLATTLFGITGLMGAVLSDAGGTILVTLNSLRLMKSMNG